MSIFLNLRHTRIYSMPLELIMARKCISFFLNKKKTVFWLKRQKVPIILATIEMLIAKKNDSLGMDGD